MRILFRLTMLLLAAGLPAAAGAFDAALKAEYRRPLDIPFPEASPYDLQIATLGKMLYFDPRLSGAQNMTCASCHNPSFGWEVPVPGAVGAQNTVLGRQAPTILNVAWLPHFFWDGRAPTLEHQAIGPMTAPVEMNGEITEIVARLNAVPEYRMWFERLFPGQGVSADTITRAIATFERTVVSAWSPFDRWVDGDETAISESAKRGFALFVGDAHCAACHSGWNFTDNRFHDIGLPGTDPGRAGIAPEEDWAAQAFKTPGLRDTVRRAPYMHDGSLPTMRAVIEHYVTGGIQRPSLAPEMQPLTLSPQDISDLEAFLETLTARNDVVSAPVLPTR